MTVFDQRNQKVNYQYNANGDINFAQVESKTDFIHQLELIKNEISVCSKNNIAEESKLNEVENRIDRAISSAKKSKPIKERIVNFLIDAQRIISGIVAMSGLVKGITDAIEIARKLF